MSSSPRTPQSVNPNDRNDPTATTNNRNHNPNIIIVNSDIIIHPGEQLEPLAEDDKVSETFLLSYSGQSGSRGSNKSRSTTDGPLFGHIPLAPSGPASTLSKQQSKGISPPIALFSPYHEGAHSQEYLNPHSTTAQLTKSSQPFETYRPIQTTEAPYPSATSNPPYRPQQYQQHPFISTSNSNDNNGLNDRSSHNHELEQRNWGQQQQQQARPRSPPPSLESTSVTSRVIDTPSSASLGTVPAETNGRAASKRDSGDGEATTNAGITSLTKQDLAPQPPHADNNDLACQPIRANNKKGLTNNNVANDNSVSRKQSFNAPSSRSGFFFLRSRKRDASELTAATAGTDSVSGGKNGLTYHHAHLRNDMVPEKYPLSHVHGAQQKSGAPGRNGEEPETDMFNFVNIMMDMPDEPTWRQVLVKMAKVLAVMTISYLALMALYFAAEFQSDAHMKNLTVMVVDLDQGMVGLNFKNFTTLANRDPGQLNWSIQNSTLYPNTSAINDQIINGYFWGAVVIQPNASSNLYKSFIDITVDYDPTKAFAFIYDGGRDPLVVKPYIVANMYTQFLLFTKYFNPAWIKFILEVSQQNNVNLTALQAAPQVLGTPVAFEEFDLHPLTATIITSATSVAYIWIFLVAGGSTYLVAHMIQPKTRNASVLKTMAMLLMPLLMFLVTLSMAYSVLLLAFGVPFPSGGSQFISLFAGMLLLQCAVASMVLSLIYLIPVVFIPSVTITFVILNVVAVFNPVDLMPKFYRWVYAMPFLNAVQISRFVLMGSYNRLRYNLPILMVWVLIPMVLLPFAISRQKRLAKEVQIEEEREAEGFRLRQQKQLQLREL